MVAVTSKKERRREYRTARVEGCTIDTYCLILEDISTSIFQLALEDLLLVVLGYKFDRSLILVPYEEMTFRSG